MTKNDPRPLTRNLAPFGVRMPPDLKDRVEAAAKANNRSMNAEIVAVLEEKYPATSPWRAAIDAGKAMNDVIELLPDGPEKTAKIAEARVFFRDILEAMLPWTDKLEAEGPDGAEQVRRLREAAAEYSQYFPHSDAATDTSSQSRLKK